MKSEFDFAQWGGLNAELDNYSLSQENLLDGIYKINFGSTSFILSSDRCIAGLYH
jgi:hypothetical protein